MEAIILTGGKGTRLRERIQNIPKTMAPINGKPFLEMTLDYLEQYSINNVVLAVGYKKEYIKEYFGYKYKNINLIYSEEEEPLGTGGAIKQALEKCTDENVLVMNGDIYAKVDFDSMMKEHLKNKNDITISVKEMENIGRFGTVKLDKNKIIKFEEKKNISKGYISVGFYIMKRDILANNIESNTFSIERDYFEKFVNTNRFGAFLYDGVFVDIGLPKDYDELQKIIN